MEIWNYSQALSFLWPLIMGEKLRASFTAEMKKLPFDIFDCYDWIDEQGWLSQKR